MKTTTLLALLPFSLITQTVEATSGYRECFDPSSGTLISCHISYGTSIHGNYLELNASKITYLIVQSVGCNKRECGLKMGHDLHSTTDANKYFLDNNLRIANRNSVLKTWTCFKQISGSRKNICFKSG